MHPNSLKNLKPPIQPGHTGNPGGKPTATRNKLNKAFLETLAKDFQAGGEEAIKRCREADPSAYVRALIALQPKEIEMTRSPLEDLSDEQLESIFLACRAILAAESGQPGTGRQESLQPAESVPAVPEAG